MIGTDSGLGQILGTSKLAQQASSPTFVKFEWPLLDDPAMAVGLLFGRDADIFRVTTPEINISPFTPPIPPIDFNGIVPFVEHFTGQTIPGPFADAINAIAGELSFHLQFDYGLHIPSLQFGYDTYAITQLIQMENAGQHPGGREISQLVLDGFYVNGVPGPEVSFAGIFDVEVHFKQTLGPTSVTADLVRGWATRRRPTAGPRSGSTSGPGRSGSTHLFPIHPSGRVDGELALSGRVDIIKDNVVTEKIKKGLNFILKAVHKKVPDHFDFNFDTGTFVLIDFGNSAIHEIAHLGDDGTLTLLLKDDDNAADNFRVSQSNGRIVVSDGRTTNSFDAAKVKKIVGFAGGQRPHHDRLGHRGTGHARRRHGQRRFDRWIGGRHPHGRPGRRSPRRQRRPGLARRRGRPRHPDRRRGPTR